MGALSKSRVTNLLKAVHADPVHSGYEILQRYESGSLVVRLPHQEDRGHSSLIKLLVEIDIKPGLRPPGDVRTTPNIIGQKVRKLDDITIVERPYFPNILSPDFFIDWVVEWDAKGQPVEEVPLRLISDVLSGLSDLHEQGLVHGDLRMSRITGDPSSGFALLDAGIPRLSQYRDIRYVPPELLEKKHPVPNRNSDIYAFFSLALDALRPFRNSPDHANLARLDARVRWLKDYFTVVCDRPSAKALHTLLIDEQIPREAQHYDLLFDEFLVSKKRHPASYAATVQTMASFLKRYPETSFAVGMESAADRIHELLKLDYDRELSYSWERYTLKRVKKYSMSHESGDFVSSFKPEIDRKWRNSIHRTFFGVVMDDNHQIRNKAKEYDDHELTQKLLYDESVELSNKARSTLLSENEFFSTAGVIHELGRAGLRLRRNEIITLRRWGAILAIPDHERWIYPRFQFQDGVLNPLVLLAHERAVERTAMDPSPWVQLTFFSVERDTLGGHALKEVLWSKRWQEHAEEVVRNAPI